MRRLIEAAKAAAAGAVDHSAAASSRRSVTRKGDSARLAAAARTGKADTAVIEESRRDLGLDLIDRMGITATSTRTKQ